MKLVRHGQGAPYQPAGHHRMRCAWLLGTAPADPCRVATLRYEPGAWVEPAASPAAKLYLCVAGTLEVATPSETRTMRPGDLCLIDADETRGMRNPGPDAAEALLVMLPPRP